MSTQYKENPGRGLSDEDLILIFPGPTRPDPITTIDFKRRASGERPEKIEGPGDEEAQVQEIDEKETLQPDFSEEPWPSPLLKDASIEGPAEPQKEAIQAIAETAGRSMIDVTKAPGARILKRVQGEVSPSDRTWRETIRKILKPAGFWRLARPFPLGSRPVFHKRDDDNATKT